ncbi:MAG: hypothetical protein V4596_12350 [Bdellovibrionota bacterium]
MLKFFCILMLLVSTSASAANAVDKLTCKAEILNLANEVIAESEAYMNFERGEMQGFNDFESYPFPKDILATGALMFEQGLAVQAKLGNYDVKVALYPYFSFAQKREALDNVVVHASTRLFTEVCPTGGNKDSCVLWGQAYAVTQDPFDSGIYKPTTLSNEGVPVLDPSSLNREGRVMLKDLSVLATTRFACKQKNGNL